MTNHSSEFFRCLEECDVTAIRKLWQCVAPDLHQPATNHEAEATIHRARTEMESMGFRLRAYSHRWLISNGYPSALPDELRPRAERIYPRIVEGVGIAVKTTSELLRPAMLVVRNAMCDAVKEAYEDRHTDPHFVRSRIMNARSTSIKRLFGI